MKNKKYKRFISAFSRSDLDEKLSGFEPMLPYSFSKRNNLLEFNTLLSFLPLGYVDKKEDDLEFADLIYSGNTKSLILTILAGRNDAHIGEEKIDVDVFNIAIESNSTESYFLNQWRHFKDENGNRTSYSINPFLITDKEVRKNITYSRFITGSTYFCSFDEYISEKPDFFKMHVKSFRDIK